MSNDTLEMICDLIADLTDAERDQLGPDTHIMQDLDLDSVDILDMGFAIEDKLGIELRVEEWREKTVSGEIDPAEFFVLSNLAKHVDALVAAKNESAG